LTTSPSLLLTATEAEFQALVIDYAHMRGWMVAHFRPSQNARGKWSTPMQGDKGCPDLVLARNGETLLVELKSEKGRVSPDQQKWVDAGGGWVAVWRPSDWPMIQRRLR
jgi:hypothetical protein